MSEYRSIVGLIPTANYLAGHPLISGSKACVSGSLANASFTTSLCYGIPYSCRSQSAVGFIITSVVFTQHLWTLVIAITTYALLVSLRRLTFERKCALTVSTCRNTLSTASLASCTNIGMSPQLWFGSFPSSIHLVRVVLCRIYGTGTMGTDSSCVRSMVPCLGIHGILRGRALLLRSWQQILRSRPGTIHPTVRIAV
jgi:hypothetical protein